MFKPIGYKVEIEPYKVDKVIFQEKDSLIEVGKVITLPENTTNINVKIGDILFFEGWGCTQTEEDPDGNKHWIVSLDEKVIKGIYEQ